MTGSNVLTVSPVTIVARRTGNLLIFLVELLTDI